MKEICLPEILGAKRREKGVTQDELAAYVGVSKASVSKWETGLSFPDITLLPILASYFDISIDDLMGYAPQLDKREIKRIYDRLSKRFAKTTFDDVLIECKALVKKYYACYPFLLAMVQLYVNHAPLAKDAARKDALLQSAIKLCERVKTNSTDIRLISQAEVFQALCYLTIGDAARVLEILGEDVRPQPKLGTLIAQAHQMLGKSEKAKEINQIELYMDLMGVFNGLLDYVRANMSDFDHALEAFRRAESLSELFQMQRLNPNNTALLYALGANACHAAGKREETLEMLSKYVDACIHGFFPFQLKGDAFFDKIDAWLKQDEHPVPRDEATIKESMLGDILLNPAFDSLHDDPEYIGLIRKLRDFAGDQ